MPHDPPSPFDDPPPPPPPHPAAVAETLRSLRPAPVPLDPVTLAFEAGRRSGHRQIALWRGAAAACALPCLALGLTHLAPPTSPNAVTVAPPAPARPLSTSPLGPTPTPTLSTALPSRPNPPPDPNSLWVLQQKVLSGGLDALPPPRARGPFAPVRLRSLLGDDL